MRSWALLVAAVALVPVQLVSQAQARPDFSGKWTLASKSVRGPGDPRFRSCTSALLLVQDQATLSVQSGDDASRASIHRFDGSDKVVAYPPVPARREGTSPTAWEGHATRFVSRAAWNGDQFVIATHSTMKMTWPSQMPGEFDRETATKAVYAYNEAGQLVIEHLVLTDPMPGGLPKRIDLPDSWTCTYVKADQANAKIDADRRMLDR